jgi:hypothetical protein
MTLKETPNTELSEDDHMTTRPWTTDDGPKKKTPNMELLRLSGRAVALAKAGRFSFVTALASRSVARKPLAGRHFGQPRLIRCSMFDVRCSMFSSLALSSLLLALLLLPAPAQVEEAPYFGDWQNAHGDKLQITSDGIKVNDEKPVRYDDITEDSDGSFFLLQVKDDSTYFEGKFLRLIFGKDPDRFGMAIYKTLPEALKQENPVKHIEWTAPPDEEKAEPGQKEEPTPPPKTEPTPSAKTEPTSEQKPDQKSR